VRAKWPTLTNEFKIYVSIELFGIVNFDRKKLTIKVNLMSSCFAILY
jgi:hypothetical protein